MNNSKKEELQSLDVLIELNRELLEKNPHSQLLKLNLKKLEDEKAKLLESK